MVVVAAVVLAATPAAAADVPPNDNFADTAEITGSTTIEVDLSAASSEAIDDEAECETRPASSVWFTYTTPRDDQYLNVHVTSQSNDVVAAVVAGNASTGLNSLGCEAAPAGETVDVYPDVRPEVRYWILVGSSGTGGSATVEINAGRIRSFEGFVRTEGGFTVQSGAAILGVYTNCNMPSEMRVLGEITQELPFAGTAKFDMRIPCDGASTTSITIPADSGRFVAGDAEFEGAVLGCSGSFCFGFGQKSTILLKDPSL